MFARVTALVTFEGFLSCVVTLVYFHTFGPSTGVVTLVTVERFFSCVYIVIGVGNDVGLFIDAAVHVDLDVDVVVEVDIDVNNEN